VCLTKAPVYQVNLLQQPTSVLRCALYIQGLNMTSTSFSSSSVCILKAMTCPAKFVERLDRRALLSSTHQRYNRRGRSVLNQNSQRIMILDIHRDRICMALASPPYWTTTITNNWSRIPAHYHSGGNSGGDNRNHSHTNTKSYHQSAALLVLPDLAFPYRRINSDERRDVSKTLYELVQQHQVLGFVVSWPVEADTGKMGAKCGRVWYTLEALQSLSISLFSQQQQQQEKQQQQFQLSTSSLSSPLFSCQRPICLWDPLHTLEESKRLDDWGRSWEFARTSTATEYHASKERYYKNDNAVTSTTVKEIWNDFCHVHWPEALAEQPERQLDQSTDALPLMPSTCLPTTTTTTRATTSRSKQHLFVDRQLQKMAVATSTA
jgi:hypothetical protein